MLHGYPEEHELQKIQDWPMKDGWEKLFEYIRERWRYADDGFFSRTKQIYSLSTGGWSGNESIIGAMSENLLFWSICWLSSERGGYYIFEVKERKKK